MARAPGVQPIRIEPEGLDGFLGLPSDARGAVLFAHGSGSGRLSPRNAYVAEGLRAAGLGTLLLDLLTPAEETDRRKVFDIELLATRLARATAWLREAPDMTERAIGYFGASTGAAAALVAASRAPDVAAIVSRGGRPDLAGEALEGVRAPTRLIVGSLDGPVIGLNEGAYRRLRCEKDLVIVPGAGHLFEEPGTLDAVVAHARDWFTRHLGGAGQGRARDVRT
jgi:putative phosphoribosyl transferase